MASVLNVRLQSGPNNSGSDWKHSFTENIGPIENFKLLIGRIEIFQFSIGSVIVMEPFKNIIRLDFRIGKMSELFRY